MNTAPHGQRGPTIDGERKREREREREREGGGERYRDSEIKGDKERNGVSDE